MEKAAAVSCSPDAYWLSGAGLGIWLTGKLGRAWHWCMALVHGMGCMAEIVYKESFERSADQHRHQILWNWVLRPILTVILEKLASFINSQYDEIYILQN